MHSTIKKTLAAVAALALLGLGAAGYVQASAAGDDADEHVTGPAADAAKAAALEITKGGKADSVERENENGEMWGVEITKADGSRVEVTLDKANKRVSVESDDDSDEGADDDSDDGPDGND